MVKNEERDIRRCLESVKNIFDEIIISDGCSTDKTVEICKEYTNKIYIHKYLGSQGEERQFVLSKANNKWVFILDGDETLSGELKLYIKNFISKDEYSVYAFARRNYYDETEKRYTKHAFYPDYCERLLNTKLCRYTNIKNGIKWKSPEILVVDNGKTKYEPTNLYLNHFVPGRYNIRSFRKQWLRWAKYESERYKNESKILNFIKIPILFLKKFFEMFLVEGFYLDGYIGFKASFIMSFYFAIIRYYFVFNPDWRVYNEE